MDYNNKSHFSEFCVCKLLLFPFKTIEYVATLYSRYTLGIYIAFKKKKKKKKNKGRDRIRGKET